MFLGQVLVAKLKDMREFLKGDENKERDVVHMRRGSYFG